MATDQTWELAKRLVITIFVLAIVLACYNRIDHAGWLPSWGNVEVQFPRTWEVGEYVICAGAHAPKAPTTLDCRGGDTDDNQTVRTMDVTFWGSLSADPRFFDCQRKSDSIRCHLP
jgi:hypothetical protein